MFSSYFEKATAKRSAQALYGQVVARARDPRFYTQFGVPDTLDGRFEMLSLHLFMLLHRLKDADAPARQVSQHVFDAFIADMDSAMREVAVGDQVVPKRLKKMTRVFYGRTGAYEEALESPVPVAALSEVLARNIEPDAPSQKDELACYMVTEMDHLRATDDAFLLKNGCIFQGDMT